MPYCVAKARLCWLVGTTGEAAACAQQLGHAFDEKARRRSGPESNHSGLGQEFQSGAGGALLRFVVTHFWLLIGTGSVSPLGRGYT
ncbi:MAG: hypothetical protein WDO74_34410 [Pseudomonadota bacterium]